MKNIFLASLMLYCGAFAFAQDSIYNSDPTQRLPVGMVKPVPGRILPTPTQENFEARVDPPSWFTGMDNDALQLMIHAKGIGSLQPSIAYPGVTIVQVTRPENSNYLFIDLKIAPDCKPGRFDITFMVPATTKKGAPTKLSFPYVLEAKASGPKMAQGLNSADFVYLLMPDRFSNGDPSNDSKAEMYQTGINRKKMYFRHGGDIKGIENHLDYIQELGVTAVWPNPVLENDEPYESYHGYAITDHYNVDKRLGTNAQYNAFVKTCHDKGMKVIMDVVLNHVGDKHYFIKDLPETDWVNQWDTLTKPNYREQSFLNPYASQHDKRLMLDGWFDAHMPDLNQRNPRVANYLIQNAIWWIAKSGHDAYRIDTYIYPDQPFMGRYIKAIRDEYPSFLCYGEAWVQSVANQAAFVKGATFGDQNSEQESLCDFQTYFSLTEALTKQQEWTGGVMKLYMSLSQDFLYQDPNKLVTFLDNHDLSRVYSVLGENPDKLKSALAFMFTTRGIPSLYYGTEILMKNFSAPDGLVREDFPGGWAGDSINKFTKQGRTPDEQAMFAYTSAMAKYRQKTTALTNGKTTLFIPVDGVFVYFRYDAEKTIMVIMNTSDKPQSPAMYRFAEHTGAFKSGKEVFDGQVFGLDKITISANKTYVLELQR